MTKKDKRAFVFNDENVTNSYGFKIRTSGISLKRFKSNPVMLDSHWNTTNTVLGSWEGIKSGNGLLTGVPVFDSEEDDHAAFIQGKVDRGFIKSCSMGIRFLKENFKTIKGELVLTKCELYEVSIVAIPSNANSVRLYAPNTSEPLSEKEIQNLCLSLTEVNEPIEIKPEEHNLKTDMKITLTAAASKALALAANTELDAAELSAKIIALEAEKKASELKLSAMLEAQEAEKLQEINTKVDAALKAGKITAENKQKFIELGIANLELLTSTLDAIPVKKNFSATIVEGTETGVKTVEDFQKLSHEEQLEFKQSQPSQYQKLFTKK